MPKGYSGFDGRNYLVAGASSGIGRRAAACLAEAGALVHAVARSRDKLSDLATAYPSGIMAQAADVCQFEHMKHIMEEFARQHGAYHGILYAAGLPGSGFPIRAIDSSYEQAILEVNYFGAVNILAQALQPGMCHTGSSVVLIASISSYEGSRGLSTYAASKAGLRELATRATAEINPEHIRVNTVSPGLVLSTGMTADMSNLPESTRDNLVKKYPLRMGEADDVVGPMLFLLSDEASCINGQDIVVDGGSIAIDHN